MRIESSDISMIANTYNERTRTVSEKMEVQVRKESSSVQVVTAAEEDREEVVYRLSDRDKQKLLLIQKFVESLTGRKMKFYVIDKVTMRRKSCDGSSDDSVSVNNGADWGFTYERIETYTEEESMSFYADGVVQTSDGRIIKFDTELNMSRKLVSGSRISLRAGNMIDPLVINYKQGPVGLSDDKISFDLDCDGTKDQISHTLSGSGFLCIDKNGDRVINNGRELFGPSTGNGFAELSLYDCDNNNWIDENDPVYDRLRIWTRNPDGSFELFALGEKGVGALYLGNLETPFSLNGGQIRRTGIFLNETGTPGTLQHIDILL